MADVYQFLTNFSWNSLLLGHCIPGRPSYKKYLTLANVFLARFCIKPCKSCTKNKAFLAKYKNSCKNHARKNCKNFLSKSDKSLVKTYLAFVTRFAKTRHNDAFLDFQIFASVSSIYLKLCSVVVLMLYCKYFSSYKAR